MSSEETLADHVRAKRKAVVKARQTAEKAAKHLETLEAELRGCEEAARAINLNIDEEAPNQDGAAVPKRGLSSRWKAVIAQMAAKYPANLTLKEIGELAKAQGLKSEEDTIRSQMHTYAGRYVERMGPGMYRVTAEGAAAAEATLGAEESENETAGAEAPAAA
jgi:hypothetical protein